MLFAAKDFSGTRGRLEAGFAGQRIEFEQAAVRECGDDGLADLVAEFGEVDGAVRLSSS